MRYSYETRRGRKYLRRYLRKKYGELCHWCGEPMSFIDKPISYDPEDLATIEHLTPRERGGTHDLSNLRLTHRRCNR